MQEALTNFIGSTAARNVQFVELSKTYYTLTEKVAAKESDIEIIFAHLKSPQ